jgi:hypothetical protein
MEPGREVGARGIVAITAAMVLAASSSAEEPQSFSVTVDPGGVDRSWTPVSVWLERGEHLSDGELSGGAGGWRGALTDAAGGVRDAQVERRRDGDGRITALGVHWLEGQLIAGMPQTYTLELSHLPEGVSTRAPSFRMEEDANALSLLHGDRPVWRHEIAFDPDRIEETYKTFHHVLDGETVLTKGLGGLYPHHRGLFVGWSRTRAGGREHNFWGSAKGGEFSQRHAGFEARERTTGPFMARSVSLVEWMTDGAPIVFERRAVTTWSQGPGRWSLDFDITLRGADGEVRLDGDPAHGGFQFRAAQEVAERKDCTYILPSSAKGGANDNWTDCPWAAARITVEGHAYWIVHMDAPSNPRPAIYNTRSYGRFGAFFRATIPAEEELRLRFRVLMIDPKGREEPGREAFERAYRDLADPPAIRLERP